MKIMGKKGNNCWIEEVENCSGIDWKVQDLFKKMQKNKEKNLTE